MNAERIAELRKLSDEWDWPEGYEMTGEIERLQAELAAIRQTCAEVAADLQHVFSDSHKFVSAKIDRLNAAAYVPTVPRPLSDAAAKKATEKAADVFAELQHCNARRYAFGVLSTCVLNAGHMLCHADSDAEMWTDEDTGAKQHVPEPQPERCNATWNGIDGDEDFRCHKAAGHSPGYHETAKQRQLWWDDAGGAKPHVPAAEKEPRVDAPQGYAVVFREAGGEKRWEDLIRERDDERARANGLLTQLRDAQDLAIRRGEIQVRLTKERDEHAKFSAKNLAWVHELLDEIAPPRDVNNEAAYLGDTVKRGIEAVQTLRKERDDAQAELAAEKKKRGPLTLSRCAWCGFGGDIASDTIREHVRTCEASPYAALRAENERLKETAEANARNAADLGDLRKTAESQVEQLKSALREVAENYNRQREILHTELAALQRRVAHLLEVNGVKP